MCVCVCSGLGLYKNLSYICLIAMPENAGNILVPMWVGCILYNTVRCLLKVDIVTIHLITWVFI